MYFDSIFCFLVRMNNDNNLTLDYIENELKNLMICFQTVDELQKTELAKKGAELGKGIEKTTEQAAESIYKSGEQISKTQAFKSVSGVGKLPDNNIF